MVQQGWGRLHLGFESERIGDVLTLLIRKRFAVNAFNVTLALNHGFLQLLGFAVERVPFSNPGGPLERSLGYLFKHFIESQEGTFPLDSAGVTIPPVIRLVAFLKARCIVPNLLGNAELVAPPSVFVLERV